MKPANGGKQVDGLFSSHGDRLLAEYKQDNWLLIS